MAAYYNEHDKFAAAWLRELIKAGLIADGEVDERSIEDVAADDVRGFVQCHFFAGIGGWSYALRLAGWDDDRPVWTGSPPCQPYSQAGFEDGMADDRDLWPAWYSLVEKCRPSVIAGEQVENAIAHGWLDRLCADLERIDYAVGAVPLPAASVGTPGFRPRLWFVADAPSPRSWPAGSEAGALHEAWRGTEFGREGIRVVERLGDASGSGLEIGEFVGGVSGAAMVAREGEAVTSPSGVSAARLADAYGANAEYWGLQRGWRLVQPASDPLAGFWAGADWLLCDDGKARPVEPGTFPLAHGIPARVGRLRGYGNAINPWLAAEVIRAYMDVTPAHED